MDVTTPSLGNVDTADVFRRASLGDEEAWEDLVLSVSSKIFNLAYSFTRDVAEAQDLTQDILFRLYRTIGQVDVEGGHPRAWIMRLARNLLIDDYRRRVRTTTTSLEDRDDLPTLRDNIEARIEFNELINAVTGRLTQRQRQVFRRYSRFLGIETIEGLAAVLDVGLKTVEAEITVIRRVLREEHAKYYETI